MVDKKKDDDVKEVTLKKGAKFTYVTEDDDGNKTRETAVGPKKVKMTAAQREAFADQIDRNAAVAAADAVGARADEYDVSGVAKQLEESEKASDSSGAQSDSSKSGTASSSSSKNGGSGSSSSGSGSGSSKS